MSAPPPVYLRRDTESPLACRVLQTLPPYWRTISVRSPNNYRQRPHHLRLRRDDSRYLARGQLVIQSMESSSSQRPPFRTDSILPQKISFLATLSKLLGVFQNDFWMNRIRWSVAVAAPFPSIHLSFQNCNNYHRGKIVQVPTKRFQVCSTDLCGSSKGQLCWHRICFTVTDDLHQTFFHTVVLHLEWERNLNSFISAEGTFTS